MLKIMFKILPVLIFLTVISCHKESVNPASKKFVSDTIVKEIDDSMFISYYGPYDKTPQSMAYDSLNDCIYLYKPLNDNGYVTGFEILQYNVSTKSLVSVYVDNDPNWYNSNGSEGKRLFFYNNELWVPGGATNDKVVRLAIGDNTVTYLSTIETGTIDYGGVFGYNPYDIAAANGIMYVVSMDDDVFYGSYSTMTTEKGHFATSATSHGSSIVAVNIQNTPYLMVKCAYDNKIELYSITGTYIRGVPINSSNGSQLIKDSEQRVYYYDASSQKIIRYSPDLLTKEEFPVKNFNSYYYGITLKELKDRVTIYCRDGYGLGEVSLKR